MIPKTLKRFASKISEVEDDRGNDNGWWVYLKPGWINTYSETHCIHETTLGECAAQFSFIEPCSCDDGCKDAGRSA